MFGQFRPVPPPKSPWHAACNYSNIINPHTSRIMMDDFGNDLMAHFPTMHRAASEWWIRGQISWAEFGGFEFGYCALRGY